MLEYVAAFARNCVHCCLFSALAKLMAGSISSGGTSLSCTVMTQMHQVPTLL